jgi:hypothetical protein
MKPGSAGDHGGAILLKIFFYKRTTFFYKSSISIQFNLIFSAMSSLLYVIAVILIIGWLLGFFVYSAGSLIHILLVIAVIAILVRLIQGRRPI